MTDSVTFQAILEQGRAQGREQGLEQGLEQGKLQEGINVVIRLGCKRFGPADSSTIASIEQVTDLSQIERFVDRLLEVNSWKELLALPGEGNGQH